MHSQRAVLTCLNLVWSLQCVPRMSEHWTNEPQSIADTQQTEQTHTHTRYHTIRAQTTPNQCDEARPLRLACAHTHTQLWQGHGCTIWPYDTKLSISPVTSQQEKKKKNKTQKVAVLSSLSSGGRTPSSSVDIDIYARPFAFIFCVFTPSSPRPQQSVCHIPTRGQTICLFA